MVNVYEATARTNARIDARKQAKLAARTPSPVAPAPTPTSTASPEITALSKSIAPTIPVSVVENPPPVAPVTTTPVDISPVNATLGAAQGLLDADMQEKDASLKTQQQKNSSQEMLVRGYMNQLGMQSADQFAFEQSAGLPQKTADYNKILNRIRIQTDEMNNSDDKAFFDQVNLETDGSSRDVTKGVVGAQQARVARERAIQRVGEASRVRANMASAALMQGDIELARDNVQKAMEAKYNPIKSALENEKFFLQRYDSQLSDAQKAQSDARKTQLDFQMKMIDQVQKAINDATPFANPQELEAMLNAQPEEAMAIAQRIMSRPAQGSGGGMAAPTVKNINGVDMQWNPQTGQWENIGTMPGSNQAETDKMVEQLQFLRSTAQKAMQLSSASGPSIISRTLGDTFVGDTKFRQLEAQANTLKTNVLALATDPSIRKYFGPQMSNADVMLIQAAGTTLNPDKQTPAQLKEEVQRLDQLFGRLQKAAMQIGSSPNIVVAPDGTQIELID
jgi:transcription elongation GreA/GreB family factor